MLIQGLCSVLLGEVVKGIYTQKVSEALLKPWKQYTQSSQDLHAALRDAFRHSSAAIALALTPDGGASARLKPAMHKEFAAIMRQRYVQPFCQDDPGLERRLGEMARQQCARLDAALAQYPLKQVTAEEIAAALYNLRFVADQGTVQRHTRLSKAGLHSTLARQGLDRDFARLLFYPDSGGGLFYDALLFFFDEAIKANQRISNLLTHFGLQQILASEARLHQQHERLRHQLAALHDRLDAAPQQAADTAALRERIEQLHARSRKLERVLTVLERNVAVWQEMERRMDDLQAGFGVLRKALEGRFDRLQEWLDDELRRLDQRVTIEHERTRQHFSESINEVFKLLLDSSGNAAVSQQLVMTQQDFLSKPFRLWEHYQQIERLGGGEQASVYKVRNHSLNAISALKVLHATHRRDEMTVARFWAEGKILGLLGSTPGQHIVNVRNMGYSADEELFIEMEFVPGAPLDQVLLEQGALSVKQTLALLRQLAVALRHAHQHQCIHRDLKPQNILVNAARSGLTLIDFGVARRLDSGSVVSQAGAFYGTPEYGAPEQFDADFGEPSPRTDIYALGIIGYQMLTNRLPFRGPTHLKLMLAHCSKPLPDFPSRFAVPDPVASLIRTCAAKSPSERYPSMDAVIAAIDAIAQQEALDEYTSLFQSFLPEITPPRRQHLERLRARLGLDPALTQEAEAELARAYTPHIGDTWRDPDSGMEFVWIPAGRFMMGQTAADKAYLIRTRGQEKYEEYYLDELPRHAVHIRQGFWLGTYPVTQAQWLQVMGENPSHFNEEEVGAEWGNHPVEKVSWDDCQAFVKRLNARRTPPQPSPTGREMEEGEFRLPTEAEWEYACRAGTETIWYFGNEEADLQYYAWHDKNSDDQTHPVGQLRPNAWGLYDMHGNVWEWCADTWHSNYDNAPDDGRARGTLGDKKAKVLRGGSWLDVPPGVRSAGRNGYALGRSYGRGVRVVVSGARTL